MRTGLIENKVIGDKLMNENKFFGIKVKSAVNVFEHNYLLNPLFPGYHDCISIKSVTEIKVDERFIE